MKIAIQGHPTRGKEVIQILESLGGKTAFTVYGFDERYCYYINPNGIIIESLITIGTKDKFSLYTLEEFEKEFPFKIGEVVFTTVHSTTFKGVVKNINFNDTIYQYDCSFEDSGKCSLGGMNVLVKCETNQLFKMKEERNITLTLEKAKEWYKKGGELKEIALQAFSEKELTKIKLPKTWKEFCDNYPVQEEYWLGNCDKILRNDSEEERTFRNWIPSKKSAEAHLAMIQLEQLRNCWRQGWKPTEYNNGYCIVHYPKKYVVMTFGFTSLLSFPTKKMAEEFLECFRDLIEKAGDLV